METFISTRQEGQDPRDFMQVKCRPCVRCGISTTVSVLKSSAMRWNAGEMLHEAFSDLSPEIRELLLTGTHGECWDAMFPDEDEYDWDDEEAPVDEGER